MIYVYDMGKDANFEGTYSIKSMVDDVFEHKKECKEITCNVLRIFENTLSQLFLSLKCSSDWNYDIRELSMAPIPQRNKKIQKICILLRQKDDQCFLVSQTNMDYSYDTEIKLLKIKENIDSSYILNEFLNCQNFTGCLIDEMINYKDKPSDHSKDSLSEFKRIK